MRLPLPRLLALALAATALLAGARSLPAAPPALPDSVAAPPGFAVPPDSLIPAGPLGASIRRGRAIAMDTRDSLPTRVGNKLACTNCHRDAGTHAEAGPWVGSYVTFPQYNARAGRVITMEDRINECLRRSLAGSPLPGTGRDMADLVAWMAWLSHDLPHGRKPAWLGYRRLAPLAPDRAAGGEVYASHCVRCHGPEGAGIGAVPPLWGAESFAIGAGMSRLSTAAAFIRWNMPFDRPGTLSDQQAFDVAAFVLSHERPDTPGKENDWPNGDPPADAAYATKAAKRPAGAH